VAVFRALLVAAQALSSPARTQDNHRSDGVEAEGAVVADAVAALLEARA